MDDRKEDIDIFQKIYYKKIEGLTEFGFGKIIFVLGYQIQVSTSSNH